MISQSLPDIWDHDVVLKPQYRTLFGYLTQNLELAIIINPLQPIIMPFFLVMMHKCNPGE